jgi:hypothetical protein
MRFGRTIIVLDVRPVWDRADKGPRRNYAVDTLDAPVRDNDGKMCVEKAKTRMTCFDTTPTPRDVGEVVEATKECF